MKRNLSTNGIYVGTGTAFLLITICFHIAIFHYTESLVIRITTIVFSVLLLLLGIILNRKELSKMNDDQLTIFRRRNIGFIFQNYNLVPILNVYENIVLPIELDGEKPDKVFVDKIVKMLGLTEKLSNLPNNLSGGQQQRVLSS